VGVVAQRFFASDVKARLRCRLKSSAENAVRRGHPWIFSDSIAEQNREGTMGELAVIYDRRDQFLAIGFFDPESSLRIRVLHTGKPAAIDLAWWQTRLESALVRRKGILDANTTACRLINGESDGWPGLVLDEYASTFVLKLYTAAWRPRVDEITALLVERLKPASLVLRLSRNAQESFATAGFHDGQILIGEKIAAPIVFNESGLRFEADVLSGQKTGFFLDQRENRRYVETVARGAKVLNAFSFSGGFSLYAARGGARSVTDLDISAHALASATRNFALNADELGIARCPHEMIQANAFDWLEENRTRQFSLIVLDPPSLAKRESERPAAIRAYQKLVASALMHLKHGGILVAASCSAHVTADEFFGAVKQAAANRKFSVIRTAQHAPDHPATFPEAEYLKCIGLQFEP
jgi:23S rRNA (cytosine1962-C5)-methyltransferase